MNGRGVQAVRRLRLPGSLIAVGAAAWPAALALGAHGAGRCRCAVTPHLSRARLLAVTHPPVAVLAQVTGPSSRAAHSVAVHRSSARALRPAVSVSLAMQAQTLA